MENVFDTNDIKVNGPEVAARILNRLPKDQKKRILKAIAASDITLFQAVSKNIIDLLEGQDEKTLKISFKQIEALLGMK